MWMHIKPRRIGSNAVQGRTVEEAGFNHFLFFIMTMLDDLGPSERRVRYTDRGFMDEKKNGWLSLSN